jgi:hypothetical protein
MHAFGCIAALPKAANEARILGSVPSKTPQ